jgi:hypothetical protein
MIPRPEHLAWVRETTWTDLFRESPVDPFRAFLAAGRVLRCVGPLDPARPLVQQRRDALLRADVLDEVEALGGEGADAAAEILDDLNDPTFTPSRLDALALLHHREDLESLRAGVTRVAELVGWWPDAPIDHAGALRIDLDASCAHLDARYFARPDIALRCALSLGGSAVDPLEADLAEALRQSAARHGRAWWLDPFAPPRAPRRIETVARMAGPVVPGAILARFGFEDRFVVEFFRDADGAVLAELVRWPGVVERPTLAWIDVNRSPAVTRRAVFALDHGQWLCEVDGSVERTDVAAIEQQGRLYALTERGAG